VLLVEMVIIASSHAWCWESIDFQSRNRRDDYPD
jgi:hypothetical protein